MAISNKTTVECQQRKLAQRVTHPPRSLLCAAAPLLPIANAAAVSDIDTAIGPYAETLII
jgi:hypothetical protein